MSPGRCPLGGRGVGFPACRTRGGDDAIESAVSNRVRRGMARTAAVERGSTERGRPKGAVVADIDEIRTLTAQLNKAFANGDATEIASWYADAARLLPDGAPRVDGRLAIEGFFAQAIDAGFNGLELETQEVTASGDLTIEIGRWTSSVGEGDHGKYVVVWKHESGRLK